MLRICPSPVPLQRTDQDLFRPCLPAVHANELHVHHTWNACASRKLPPEVRPLLAAIRKWMGSAESGGGSGSVGCTWGRTPPRSKACSGGRRAERCWVTLLTAADGCNNAATRVGNMHWTIRDALTHCFPIYNGKIETFDYSLKHSALVHVHIRMHTGFVVLFQHTFPIKGTYIHTQQCSWMRRWEGRCQSHVRQRNATTADTTTKLIPSNISNWLLILGIPKIGQQLQRFIENGILLRPNSAPNHQTWERKRKKKCHDFDKQTK